MKFKVLNPDGSKPDLCQIALTEPWAHGLIWWDMEGFAIDEHGDLLLMDECGNIAFAPQERFTVVWEQNS